MIRTAPALFSAALVISSALFAQSAEKAPQNAIPLGLQQKANAIVIQLGSCPVAMHARQGGLTMMIKTGQKPPAPQQYQPTPKPSQRIHLILSGFGKGKRVASAIVTARGLSAHTRLQDAATNSSPDLRRTLDVNFTPDQDNTVSADLDLPAFTSVSSLQLESITYSDGSSWEPTSRNQCLVPPDGMMLIAGN